MEDAKYCGRDWIPTGNWPQVQYKPAYNRTTPGDLTLTKKFVDKD